jgi:purine-binding chemotaxis protein CheW
METGDGFHAVSFRVGTMRLALDAARVLRVIAAVAPSPAPGAADILLGVVNLAGELLPLADVGFRLGQGRTVLTPRHAFILARTARRRLFLAVDAVEGVIEVGPGEVLDRASLPGSVRYMAGALRRPDGSLWLQDPDAFLSWDEEAAIDAALQGKRPGGEHAA